MAGLPKSQSVEAFSSKIRSLNDHSLDVYLFPIDGSNAAQITVAAATEFQDDSNLRQRVEQAFLRAIKDLGFWRSKITPPRIRLRPENSKTIISWDEKAWLSEEHPEHDRISRMIKTLRALGLVDLAQAFYTELSNQKRITSKVGATSQEKWRDAMNDDLSDFLIEEPVEDGNSSDHGSTNSNNDDSSAGGNGDGEEFEKTQTQEQQVFLERLIREGEAKFGSNTTARKRKKDEASDDDDGQPRKRQKNKQANWAKIRRWLERYSNPRDPDPPIWSKIFEQRMQIHRNEYNGAADKPNFKKASYNLPYMNSVVPWAIGSLWAPLRKQREFAFGDSALFAKDTRDRLGRIDACGQRHDRMLIPMFFPSSAQEQDAYNDANTDGHLVLVLAKKTPDESDVVELELYNSLPGWFKDNRRRKNNRRDKDNRKDEDKPIAREAGTILRLSNWMGRKGEVETPSDRRYNFILTPIDVPTQKSWRHTCGLHTILAGWALLLGIPLHEHLDRRKPSMEEEEFVDKGKEIVDLAIAGFMDSTTIQAFLQASGMVVAQDASDEAVRVVHVGTMVMSDDLLKAVVLEDKGYDEVWWVMQ